MAELTTSLRIIWDIMKNIILCSIYLRIKLRIKKLKHKLFPIAGNQHKFPWNKMIWFLNQKKVRFFSFHWNFFMANKNTAVPFHVFWKQRQRKQCRWSVTAFLLVIDTMTHISQPLSSIAYVWVMLFRSCRCDNTNTSLHRQSRNEWKRDGQCRSDVRTICGYVQQQHTHRHNSVLFYLLGCLWLCALHRSHCVVIAERCRKVNAADNKNQKWRVNCD